MTLKMVTVLIGGVLAAVTAPAAAGSPDYDALAQRAVCEYEADARRAREALRAHGPSGLTALRERYGASIDAYRAWLAAPDASSFDPAWERVAEALDAVGGQRDNYAAGLYWYTDLGQATAAARHSGKPILSLRLLGRLTDDLSCANSRFLRTAVYANARISAMLRDAFVLHWESVRPVPKITIDFGDGRTICRTITGNSMHYVLDGEGRPIDALPGLCGPRRFEDWLITMRSLHGQFRNVGTPAGRGRLLRAYHDGRYSRIIGAWQTDLASAGHGDLVTEAIARQGPARPEALFAAPVAITKAAIEVPILAATMAPVAERLDNATTEVMWREIAAAHLDEARLDDSSRRLMAKKARVTPAMIDRFERSLALDTVRNEYLYHRQIHQWFVNGEIGELAALTDRIYAELFLTPGDDPWLGLLPADTYAALEHGGVVQ